MLEAKGVLFHIDPVSVTGRRQDVGVGANSNRCGSLRLTHRQVVWIGRISKSYEYGSRQISQVKPTLGTSAILQTAAL
jgi:hypothetical protein